MRGQLNYTLEHVNLGRIRFDESGFRFTVNTDLDSLANQMVWIRGCYRNFGSDGIVIRSRL